MGKVPGRGQRLLMCYTKIIVEVYSSVRLMAVSVWLKYANVPSLQSNISS